MGNELTLLTVAPSASKFYDCDHCSQKTDHPPC